MKKIEFETLTNLIQVVVIWALGLTALIGALVCGAYWHFGTALLCYVLGLVLYKDKEYGTVSVEQWVKEQLGKK